MSIEKSGEIKKSENKLEQFTNSFIARIEKIAKEMEGQGLNLDAGIVRKTEDRIKRRIEMIINKKKELEDVWGRKLFNITEIQDMSKYTVSFGVPVTYQRGDGGGREYKLNGNRGKYFDNAAEVEKYMNNLEEGSEIVNYIFSEKGKEQFFRKMGILEWNQKPADMVGIFEKKYGNKINHGEYRIKFPTNIDGVELSVMRLSHDSKYEEEIFLAFNSIFFGKLFEE